VRELVAHGGDLALALGERPSADAARPHPLEVADAVPDLGQELFDLLVSGHAPSLASLRENRLGPI